MLRYPIRSDMPVSWASHLDIAEVAVALFERPEMTGSVGVGQWPGITGHDLAAALGARAAGAAAPDGFEARVIAIYVQWEEQDDGTPERVVFEVVGGARGRFHTRFIRAERIQRVAQVRTSTDGIQTRRERKR